MSDDEIKKALTFLLDKSTKEFSLEKKKEFLAQKVSKETVEKALSLLPIIEANVTNQINDYKEKNPQKSFFDSFFDFGVISTVILVTLGFNYLMDFNRNKKNELWLSECENKIMEESKKATNSLQYEVSKTFNNYVDKSNLKNEILKEVKSYTQNQGLNLNLSSKNTKQDILELKSSVLNIENKVKEVEVKIENKNLIFKTEIFTELSKLIEQNNKNLLIEIIKNQDKLLLKQNENQTNSTNSNSNLNIYSHEKNNNSLILDSNAKNNADYNKNFNNLAHLQTQNNNSNLITNNKNINSLNATNLFHGNTRESQIFVHSESNPITKEKADEILKNHVENEIKFVDNKDNLEEDKTDFKTHLSSILNSLSTEKEKKTFYNALKVKIKFLSLKEPIKFSYRYCKANKRN